ncbi:MAG: TusE/DsrC/DsvC family sulfur relay protein [Granulosicoccus sp.]|nr:TusE/DsrC/DsvC family sulfur relay protein [Granulosicoccus sp.]
MNYEYNGNTVESDEDGYLVNTADWSEELAAVIATEEGISLNEKHWDVLQYLRTEYFTNDGIQPMERAIKKAMETQWQIKLSNKEMYELFPSAPSKQGAKIAGLPPTSRKGGY